jgi:3-oxoacyl-[acyl-carrier protein] reductase
MRALSAHFLPDGGNMGGALAFDLSGKKAVVTGGGRGIGRAVAISLAQGGAHVVCVSKSEESCGKTAAELLEAGLSAEFRAVDVARAEEVAAACREILAKHSAVDILVNNAGITQDGLLLRMAEESWQNVLRTNLDSCFHWTKNLLYPMVKRRWGRIVNMTSVVGIVGNAGQTNYAAAKAGVIGFTKSVAREVASRGITANAVAPGFIRTAMTAKLGDAMVAEIQKTIPLGELGTVEDVAGVVGFLCSPAARYITGHVINVDGGMAM